MKYLGAVLRDLADDFKPPPQAIERIWNQIIRILNQKKLIRPTDDLKDAK